MLNGHSSIKALFIMAMTPLVDVLAKEVGVAAVRTLVKDFVKSVLTTAWPLSFGESRMNRVLISSTTGKWAIRVPDLYRYTPSRPREGRALSWQIRERDQLEEQSRRI